MQHNTEHNKLKGSTKVRVYALLKIDETFSSWEEVGTGYISFISDIAVDNQTNYEYLTVTPLNSGKIGELAEKINHGKNTSYILYSRLDKLNHYQKQETTIITWEDRILNYEIAISFIEKEQCQNYWKLICSKIGKNYLEIGNLKQQDVLEAPTQNNLVYIMQNVKNRQDLITYHVINKTKFMPALKQLVNRLQRTQEEGLKFIYRIIKAIICYNDTRILQVFFSAQYFETFLQILKYSDSNKSNINYAILYRKKEAFGSLIQFGSQYNQKIIMQNNINFYREYILNLRTDTVLQNFLNQVYNQANLEILSYLTKNNIMEKVAEMLQSSFFRVLTFLAELIALLKQFQEELRFNIMDSIYQSSILKRLAKSLNNQLLMNSLQSKKVVFFQILGSLGLFGQKMYLDFLKSNSLTERPSLIFGLANSFFHDSIQIKKIITYFLQQSVLMSHPNDKNEWIDFVNINFNENIGLLFFQENNRKRSIMSENNQILDESLDLTLFTFFEYLVGFAQIFGTIKIFKIIEKYELVELALKFLNQNKINSKKSQQISLLKLMKIILSHKQMNKQLNNNNNIENKDITPIANKEILKKDVDYLFRYLVKSNIISFFINILKQNYRKNNLVSSLCFQILHIIFIKDIQIMITELLKNQNELPRIPQIIKILSKDDNQINTPKDENLIEKQKHLHILLDQEQEKYLENIQQQQVQRGEKSKVLTHSKTVLQQLQIMTKQISKSMIQEEEMIKVEPKQKESPTGFHMQFNLSFVQQLQKQENQQPRN